MNIPTTIYYWDCDCQEDYIHPKQVEYCPICGAEQDSSPDSRYYELSQEQLRVIQTILLGEIADYLNFIHTTLDGGLFVST